MKVGVTKTLHLRVALLADTLADADEAFAKLAARLARDCPAPGHNFVIDHVGRRRAQIVIRDLTVTP